MTSVVFANLTYTWSLTCEGSKFQAPGIVSGAHATWNWTVNGVAENAGSGSATCSESGNSTSTVSASGAVPTSANGITASVRAQTGGRTCTTTTSQSFSNKGTVSIKNLSVTCQGVESGESTFIEAIFNLQS